MARQDTGMQKKRLIIFLTVAVLGAAVDLATKAWADSALKGKPGKTVVPDLVDLNYGLNKGAALGLLSDSELGPPILTAISIAAAILLGILTIRIRERPLLTPLSLGLVLSGVLGNLHDRLFNEGNVRDMIDLHWGDAYHWPLFNVADAAITAGVILLILLSFFPGKKQPGKKKARAGAA